MTSTHSLAGVFCVAATLCLANCSMQNFDYLKNEFPVHAGASGAGESSSGSGGSGNGNSGSGNGSSGGNATHA